MQHANGQPSRKLCKRPYFYTSIANPVHFPVNVHGQPDPFRVSLAHFGLNYGFPIVTQVADYALIRAIYTVFDSVVHLTEENILNRWCWLKQRAHGHNLLRLYGNVGNVPIHFMGAANGNVIDNGVRRPRYNQLTNQVLPWVNFTLTSANYLDRLEYFIPDILDSPCEYDHDVTLSSKAMKFFNPLRFCRDAAPTGFVCANKKKNNPVKNAATNYKFMIAYAVQCFVFGDVHLTNHSSGLMLADHERRNPFKWRLIQQAVAFCLAHFDKSGGLLMQDIMQINIHGRARAVVRQAADFSVYSNECMQLVRVPGHIANGKECKGILYEHYLALMLYIPDLYEKTNMNGMYITDAENDPAIWQHQLGYAFWNENGF